MAWASTPKVAMGCIAFVLWWIFAIFPAIPFFPIGRIAGSILGATLMVVFRVISPNQAFAAVDLPILGLLFGTMVISIYLERADLFKYLGNALSWKMRGGMDLLCRVCLLAALSSSLFTNDTTCVLLTGFVLQLCREKKLRPGPFLIALACSSNIGSAATPIGNPQNFFIAVSSSISFGSFLAGMLPAVAIGLVVNTLLLLVVYGRNLSLAPGNSTPSQQTVLSVIKKSKTPSRDASHVKVSLQVILSEEYGDGKDHDESTDPKQLSNQRSIALTGHGEHTRSGGDEHMEIQPHYSEDNLEQGAQGRSEIEIGVCSFTSDQSVEHVDSLSGTDSCDDSERHSRGGKLVRAYWRQHRKRIWKIIVYLVTIGMLAALLAGLSLPWTAITAAVVMMILDFSDAGPSLDKVSYSLLVFFSGMFIATSGFNATGAPEEFWTLVEPHSRISTVSGVSVLSLVVIVLSNVASNEPTVILLGPRVAASAEGTAGASSEKAWLILAWVSTVAGNLTLVGSAANLIVCEQARPTAADKALPEGQWKDRQNPDRPTYILTFWEHLKFGFLSTLIVNAVGLLPLVVRKF